MSRPLIALLTILMVAFGFLAVTQHQRAQDALAAATLAAEQAEHAREAADEAERTARLTIAAKERELRRSREDAEEARQALARARDHLQLTSAVQEQDEEGDLIMVETFDDDQVSARFRMNKTTKYHLTTVEDGHLLIGQTAEAKGSVDVIARQTFSLPVGASVRVYFSA
jgi:hypothetical protein